MNRCTNPSGIQGRPLGRMGIGLAVAIGLVPCVASAASYTWDNGVGTADYIGTGQWSNNTNWDPTSPSGGPVAGDDLTFNLYLDNPAVPRTSGTVSGTAVDVAFRRSGTTTTAQTVSMNSMTFTGTSAKYIWAVLPTATNATQVFFHPTGGISLTTDSGPVFFGNANATATGNANFRLQASQSFVNSSDNDLTFGTPANTAFDPGTLVGGNGEARGFVLNGPNAGTTPAVLTVSAAGTGDVIFNGNLSNGTGGLQLVVNSPGAGKVIANANLSLTSGNLLSLPNPSGLRVLAGTLELGGTAGPSSTLAASNGIELATGGDLVIRRTGTFGWGNSTYGGGTLDYDGGTILQVTGSLGHTGGTAISSGTVQLAAGGALGAGNIAVAGGATFDVSQATALAYSGTISGGGRLVKGGAGTLALAANNSFTGGITIADDAGVGGISMAQLAVSQLITGTGIGTLAIAGGGTLDISTANGAGGLAFRLDSPGTSDQVTVAAGSLQLGSGAVNFDDFAFAPLGGFDIGTYTLFSANSVLGSLGSTPSGTIGDKIGTLQLIGNTLQLAVTAVPEPSTTAALAAGLAMSGLVLRRRRPD
jgi:fibronectin-binding autotransporter adhesin